MAITVDTPKGPVEFPDGTPPDVITAAIQKMNDFQAGPQKVEQREVYDYKDPDAGSALNPLLSGATFNLADEAMGGVAALYASIHDAITGKDSGITYKKALESVRDDQKAFAERNPVTDVALQVAGGVATGGIAGTKALASQAVRQAPKLAKALAVPAVAGAEGYVAGFGAGEDLEDRITKGGETGLTSMILAPVVGKIAKVVGRKVTDKLAKKEFGKTAKNTAEQMRNEGQAFYKKLERSNVKVTPKAFSEFKTGLARKMGRENIDPFHYPQLSKAFKDIDNMDAPTIKELMAVKRLLRNAKGSRTDDQLSLAANYLDEKVDDFIGGLKKSDVSKGRVQGIRNNLDKAKNRWSRYERSTTLDDMMESAKLSEGHNIYGDLDKALRDEARGLIKSPRKRYGMDEKSITGLKDMIKGDTSKRLTRMIGQMDPGAQTARGMLPTTGAAGGAVIGGMTGGPGAAGLGAIIGGILPSALGRTFKKIANRVSADEWAAIQHAILNEGDESLKSIAKGLVEKYRPVTGGVAAATSSSLADMINQ